MVCLKGLSHNMPEYGGFVLWHYSERTASIASEIPLTSFSLFRVHQTYNEAFVHLLYRLKQWHSDGDRNLVHAVWVGGRYEKKICLIETGRRMKKVLGPDGVGQSSE